MKNFIKRASKTVLRSSGKIAVKILKVTPAATSGFLEFTQDFTSDSYYAVRGNSKKNKLIAELKNQNIKFQYNRLKFKKDYPYADACILSGLTASEMYLKGIPPQVLEAYQLAFPDLSNSNSFLEVWGSFDDYESRLGFVNAVKGKLFELQYLNYLNDNLEPGYVASLASSVNQSGWDIKITGPNSETAELLQLKATTSINYVKEAIERYPNIDVITLSDLQGQLSSVTASSELTASTISNQELLNQIADATDSASYWYPAVPLIGVGYVVFSSYLEKDISDFLRHQKIAKRTSNLLLDSAIIGVSMTPLIGIPIVLGKAFLFRRARKDKEIVRYLKAQLKQNQQSQKFWEKRVSRRSFIKGLTLASATITRKPKLI